VNLVRTILSAKFT